MITLRRTDAPDLLCAEVTNEANGHDIRKFLRDLHGGRYAGALPRMPLLVDCAGVSLLSLSSREVDETARACKELSPLRATSPLAVLVRPGGSVGIAQMFSIRLDLMELRRQEDMLVTEDRVEAAAWLLHAMGETRSDPAELLEALRFAPEILLSRLPGGPRSPMT
jgi:hypothetical protein